MKTAMRLAAREDLREGFRSRLARLMRLRKEHADEMNPGGMRTLDDAIVRAFADLASLGETERQLAAKLVR